MFEETETESQTVLHTLRENDFQECLKSWQCRWDGCQASVGPKLKVMPAPNILGMAFLCFESSIRKLIDYPSYAPAVAAKKHEKERFHNNELPYILPTTQTDLIRA